MQTLSGKPRSGRCPLDKTGTQEKLDKIREIYTALSRLCEVVLTLAVPLAAHHTQHVELAVEITEREGSAVWRAHLWHKYQGFN